MTVLGDVAAEREKQDEQWGAYHDDHHTVGEWKRLIEDHLEIAMRAQTADRFRHKLVTVAALAVAWAEAVDRRAVGSGADYHPTHSE
jgi:hypothetical protein